MREHLAPALEELRKERTLLDQVIRALELLIGAPAPSEPPAWLVDGKVSRRAARRSRPATKRRAPGRQAAPGRARKPWKGSRAEARAELVLTALRALGGSAKPQEVQRRLGLSRFLLNNVRNGLIKRGELIVEGSTTSARWSLPGKPAKEVP